MSADPDPSSSSRPNGAVDYDHVPSTPPDATATRHSSSQQSISSTEGPNSPVDPSTSFKTELNDDRHPSSQVVIPSSLTPPPSSQVPPSNGAAGMHANYVSSQRANIFSPPATAFRELARDGGSASDYVAPTPSQVADASADELRTMILTCLAENAKLKMETAHHKLQYSLLSLQADEDAKRAVVEHDMTRREVEVLRMTENSRQARRELNAVAESTRIKYRELQTQYHALVKENEALQKRVKSATKLIQQQSEERDSLVDERDMLLNRIRENREHFNMLCSPGGAFYGALTPKTPAAGFAALLQALSHDNSAPSTPTAAHRPALRMPPKHTRGAQSLSSLPTTPTPRTRGEYSGLLPSADLVPQTEPPNRYSSRFAPDTPVLQKTGLRSRESTISADDNEELARAALESVAAATQSYMSQGSRASRRREEEIFESQASQAASEMLRRDPRESFDVASSVGSRDATPAPAEKTAKLQSKLFAGLNKVGLVSEKRKFSDGSDSRHESVASPPKKMRYGPGGGEGNGRGLSAVLAKSPYDTVILSSLRTPVCRSYRGQLKDAYPEELLSVVLRATLDANPNLPPEAINDVAVGVVLSELGGSKAARAAINHIGFPNSTSLYTVNRACSSSLQSIATVAAQIRTEMISVGIAAGMESMTRNYGSRAIPVNLWPELKETAVKDARDCIMPMGLTSENVAARYEVGRKEQDEFAVESHRRVARAQAEGRFDAEIVPVRTRFQEVDKQGNKVGDEKRIEVTKDDGIRANATLEALAKLKPAFKEDGSSTAGNSSQVSDGAAATLLMRRSTATELGLTSSIVGKFVAATTAGCAPDEMGIGPALAIPKLLGQLGLAARDVDRWEINEAFASQSVYCVRELGLQKDWEEERVNPDGGAIALGHPLGATGARMTSTLIHGLGRTGGQVGVVSMCVGTGMGMAGLFVREH
ncbi:Thiolase, N-terminal domain-containing protein [Durotheca rogersii]|uniref:Thiolase, N-terminal domain-containing protein n=1 Tax=Durotheca rogersii TaxID=419775 RepID=UPI0022211CD5|nr:Thiolase, N-terminal domain-containing protein [Durotheca rogersii]KAI5856168.1 Thiolase, N-terminal domain-containing protein [Durotheca rogersii]